MATKKRSKGGRRAAPRAKATGRGRAVRKAAPKKPAARASSAKRGKPKAAAKPKVFAKPKAAAKPKVVAKPKAAAKPKATAKPKRGAAAPKRVAPKAAPVAVDSHEVVALKNRFQRERSGFEKRLTEAVREIGMLRHHELRAMQLERQLAERDATIARLQQQLADLERRPAAESVVYVHEVQQSLALAMPSREVTDELAAAELDEFEEQQLVDEGDFADEGDIRSDD